MSQKSIISPIATVAPYAGAWIEIVKDVERMAPKLVAPYAGAWIEIFIPFLLHPCQQSLPTRERGLKYSTNDHLQKSCNRRSLRGSVD